MKYHLLSMYTHMVGLAASVISPFYFILLRLKRQFLFYLKLSFIINKGVCPIRYPVNLNLINVEITSPVNLNLINNVEITSHVNLNLINNVEITSPVNLNLINNVEITSPVNLKLINNVDITSAVNLNLINVEITSVFKLEQCLILEKEIHNSRLRRNNK